MVTEKDLWPCPVCGHKFVTPNMWHSCGIYDFEPHFEGKDPCVLAMYKKYRSMVESRGAVMCYAQKTRIVFQARIRLASCQTRKKGLRCGLILRKQYPDAKNLIKIERFGTRCFGHYFEMTGLDDFDGAFQELIREAFLSGGWN